jgi:hypothetical protein
MSHALHMPVRRLQQLLPRVPLLARSSPQQVQNVLQALHTQLGFSPCEARRMVVHASALVLNVPPQQLASRAAALAQLLKTQPKAVLAAAGSAPSLLHRDPAVLGTHLLRMSAALGGLTAPDMLQLAAGAPQFLTASPAAVSKRLAEASTTLRRPPHLVVRALFRQPDLLFLSPRILANKVRVLQRILNRPKRLVTPLVLACPALLRSDMDGVRAAYSVLPAIARRDADFAFAMVRGSKGMSDVDAHVDTVYHLVLLCLLASLQIRSQSFQCLPAKSMFITAPN